MLQKLLNNNNVINIYQYGSRVYDCFTHNSDYDYIVIVNNNYSNLVDNIELNNYHFNFYTLLQWQEKIKNNNIEALECLCLDNKFILKEIIHFTLDIDLVKLRQSISRVCSNSYDKCRKKLIIEKDFAPYIAKKSLWHCIRILLFGIQVAQYGKIIDYTVANKYYNDIVLNENNTWDYYKTHWHIFCNNLRSEFRKHTESAWTKFKNGGNDEI